MGGELSCPCGKRLDIEPQQKPKLDHDIITEIMKGKLQKESLLYEYSVNNDDQATKVYLISTTNLEAFFANRNLLIIETKHDINYYYNRVFVSNFLNQDSIAFILLQYQKGKEDRSTYYSKSKAKTLTNTNTLSNSGNINANSRPYRSKDYSAVYKVDNINFISKDNERIKEQILNDLYSQLKKENCLLGIVNDPIEKQDDQYSFNFNYNPNINYNHSYSYSYNGKSMKSLSPSLNNNYKIIYKKSKLSDNLDIQYYILVHIGKLTCKVITGILNNNKDKTLKSVIKEGGNGAGGGRGGESSCYFFIFEQSNKTPEYDENEFFVVKIEKDKQTPDMFLKDIAEKVNMQTKAEILTIVNDAKGFFVIFKYDINNMDD